ncbi:MAG TPA: FxsA family protein, partial [Alphaproteobacteria bacterium]|nr:FxsA family protein [Alphaproteobacteria bacterium]
MPLLILLAFIAVPMIEIAVFIKVGGLIGLWPTLAIVILTAILGTAALRQQGLSTLRRAQEAMNRNELPVREVFDGLCLLVAGALLLTPGFVTDALGALLFVPQVRTLLRNLIGRHLLRNAEVHVGGFPGEGGRARDGRG